MAIQKGKVELSKNSLIPNKRGLWYTAFEKLDEANIGRIQMEKASDRIEYENGWTRFVESTEEAWTSFYDEGKNKFSKFQPWAGKIIKERKEDDLLKYLYQARHQSQHGNLPLEWSEGKINIGRGFNGYLQSLTITPDGSFEAEATSLDKNNKRFKLEHEAGVPKLPTIKNKKHNQVYAPPKKHLSKKITDSKPHRVAELAINYYKDKFEEALKKFSDKTTS